MNTDNMKESGMKAVTTGAAIGVALFGLCGQVSALADSQLNSQIKQVAESYLKSRIADIPGKATIVVTEPSRSSRLAGCSSLEAFQTENARRLGKTSIGVRCLAPSTWSIYLSARVGLVTQYLAAAVNLRPGQKLAASDIVFKAGDIGALPDGVALTAEQAIDHTLVFGVLAGTPLRSAMLREPPAVQQGQSVKLVLNGNGFQVSAEAVALGNANDGQVVRTKTSTGQVISGIAQSGGTVQVVF
ncbi:MAG: flagellar basal body P-ring formation chaperone FlgA [Thiobacillaceae bacterium]